MNCPNITNNRFSENWPVRSLGIGTSQIIRRGVVVQSGDHSKRIQAQCQVDLHSGVGVKMAAGLLRLSAATTAIHLMTKVSVGVQVCVEYQNIRTCRENRHVLDRYLLILKFIQVT
jgi:hypothetical protein